VNQPNQLINELTESAAWRRGDLKIKLSELIIGIKGAGEMASAVAWRIFMANIRKIFMMEIAHPQAVRREVAFCEAVHEGYKAVEGVEGVLSKNPGEIQGAWKDGQIAVVVDPTWQNLKNIRPDAVIDAILAKKNCGTTTAEAALVIGLGPGFTAGQDVHTVIETNRGHHLGRIVTAGSAEANTGIPGPIGGFAEERVLRSPLDGQLMAKRAIGDLVVKGEVVATVEGLGVPAGIDGVIRGLIRSGSHVHRNLKIGDIDPRGEVGYCYTISDKARAIAGSVLEVIMRVYNH
jgi:xanthine dehydrogenase accessory factor